MFDDIIGELTPSNEELARLIQRTETEKKALRILFPQLGPTFDLIEQAVDNASKRRAAKMEDNNLEQEEVQAANDVPEIVETVIDRRAQLFDELNAAQDGRLIGEIPLEDPYWDVANKVRQELNKS